MAPATDSVTGSLPRAKASIGSAMNDTAAAQLPARTAGPAQGSR
jgi:hypothetical protein